MKCESRAKSRDEQTETAGSMAKPRGAGLSPQSSKVAVTFIFPFDPFFCHGKVISKNYW